MAPGSREDESMEHGSGILKLRQRYDAVVVGGGPSGAIAAWDLARRGHSVLLLDRAGRIKPCGGAIPPKLIEEFDIPEHLLVARIRSARMVAPSGKHVDMPIDGGFVGMVDRGPFDEWLRERAARAGAQLCRGVFLGMERDAAGMARVRLRQESGAEAGGESGESIVSARAVIGADGAVSKVAEALGRPADSPRFVYAFHEILESPHGHHASFDPARCDVHYRGKLSPDFYGWVFPHGATTSVGTGTALKGFSLRTACAELRHGVALGGARVLRREGAPIPVRPRRRWDNGKDIVLAGDAAGVVAPASGEGIYYAMLSGRIAAVSVDELLSTGDARCLKKARNRFMRAHGRVFWVLGIMQHFWYSNDRRRERFVSICRDPDVQKLTWEAYMHKRLVRAKPMAHVRIFFKDLAHLLGLVSP